MAALQATLLALSVLLSYACCQDPTITCTPANTCLRAGSPEDVVCTCVSSSPSIVWQVATRQLVDRNRFVNQGITVDDMSGNSTITLNSTGRSFVAEQSATEVYDLTCLIGETDFDLGPIDTGATVLIGAYGPPPPPLDADIFPTSTELQVLLSWTRPSIPPCIPVNYNITVVNLVTDEVVLDNEPVSGMAENFTFTEMDSNECELHEFSIASLNDAGSNGESVVINETIPITPNTAPITASLTATPVLDEGYSIDVTFQPATSCDPDEYPVLKYIITIAGLDGSLNVSHDDSSELVSARLTSTSFPEIAEDEYTVEVQACASFACRSPVTTNVLTSDVQSANITFLNTTVALFCVFADTGSASGCRFVLSLTDGTREEMDISRPSAGGTVSMECAQTNNRKEAYSSIEVFTIQSDRSLGSLAVSPNQAETTRLSDILPCAPEPPTEIVDDSLSGGEIAAIIIAVLVVFAIIVAIIIAIVYWQRTKIGKLVRTLSDDEGIDLMVREVPNEKPTITMLLENIHTPKPTRKSPLTREVSHQPDLAVGSPQGGQARLLGGSEPLAHFSPDGPIASIKLTGSKDPNHVRLTFNPISLAHYINIWKKKASNNDEIPLFCKHEEEEHQQ